MHPSSYAHRQSKSTVGANCKFWVSLEIRLLKISVVIHAILMIRALRVWTIHKFEQIFYPKCKHPSSYTHRQSQSRVGFNRKFWVSLEIIFMKILVVIHVILMIRALRDHPFKTSENFHNFWPLPPYHPHYSKMLMKGIFESYVPSAHVDTPTPLRHANVLNRW